MSHAAIAAVLALEDLAVGERLAALSLASFANREQRAWPGTRLAAARAGLSRSQYLVSREGLVGRGLVTIEDSGSGRGQSPSLSLLFASAGPWFEADVNAELVEAVLSHSRTRGAARALLATLAAVADQSGSVSALSTEEIRSAAGMADSTYRRARAALLDSDELVLETAGGGRANTNRWIVRDPRSVNPTPITATRARPQSPNARPLIAATRPPSRASAQTELPALTSTAAERRKMGPGLSGVSALNPGQSRTVSLSKGPGLSGVSDLNPGQNRTVSLSKGPELSGVSAQTPPETPSQTPPETPPPNARAGREPQNPKTQEDPPTPLAGGHESSSVTIVENYVTDRGRHRQRTVTVELDEAHRELSPPGADDRSAWAQVRSELERLVGDSAFAIWLSPLELLAADPNGVLLLGNPVETREWVSGRYGPLIPRAAHTAGCDARLVTDRELQLLRALGGVTDPILNRPLPHDHQEAV